MNSKVCHSALVAVVMAFLAIAMAVKSKQLKSLQSASRINADAAREAQAAEKGNTAKTLQAAEVTQMITTGMLNDDPPLSQSPSTTVLGCTCKADSKCGATLTLNRSFFACDWCRTEGDCGHGTFRKWDYCQYPEMDKYEKQTAEQKMKQLWGKVTEDKVVGLSGPASRPFTVVTTIIGESMRTPFDTHWDVLPEGRTKVIHSQGVHCQFELEIFSGSPFTGLLASGTQAGIIRIGSATSLDETKKPPFPGLSLKFLRSGVQSGNFVVLRETGTDGGTLPYAFFDKKFSTNVAPPPALQALMKFDQASQCISKVGLSDMCKFGQDGTDDSGKIKFPYDILFEASPDNWLRNEEMPDEERNKHMSDEELLAHLSSIQEGSRLFDVYAKASPKADAEKLGKLTTTSQCVKSLFGDQSLFFRHQRMEEDFVKEPSWVEEVTELKTPGCKAAAEPSVKWQCPGVV